MMNHPMTTLLAISLALALFPASQLWAQPDQARHHGPPDAEMRVAHMSRALELSDEQSARLLEVFQAVDEERQALHEQAMLQMKPQLCELQLATRAEVHEILDAEQLARLEDMKARRESDNDRRKKRGMHDLDCSAYE
jgi:Spy/CpxP family protein refolding chaperone